MNPINDLAKIELETDQFGFQGDKNTAAESGILVALPEEMPYFGFWSFAFEDSLANADILKELATYYKDKIGKRVYWTALSEKGNVLELDGKQFAFVKLTSLIAWSEPDIKATAVGSGQFSA